jgi:branched-subunit amino acid ABC-type transport system permease component
MRLAEIGAEIFIGVDTRRTRAVSLNQIDLLVGALAIGGVYSLIALGFSMIIRATGILHFAQGDVMMMGSMAGLAAVTAVPLPLPAILIVGMAFAGLIGVAMELLIYRNLRNRGVPLMNIITATLGMSILLINTARLIWGSEPMRYPPLFSAAVYQFGSLRIAPQLLWIMVMSVALMILLQLFLQHTRTGLAIQAAAQDPEAAEIMGVNLTRARAYTFGIGGALAGAAGVMLGSMFFAYFEMGFVTGIKGFVAATLGGLGSIGGAMVGGMVFGLIETYGAVFVSSAYKDAIGMILLILLLLIFPSGLAGMWRGRR